MPPENVEVDEVLIVPETVGQIWMIRAGQGSTASNMFLSDSVIALSGHKLQDLTGLSGHEAFRRAARDADPGPEVRVASRNRIGTLLYRFVKDLSVGDLVVMTSARPQPRVWFGRVTGEYFFEPVSQEYPHRRAVKWIASVPRERLASRLLKETSYFYPLYQIKREQDSFWKLVASLNQPSS